MDSMGQQGATNDEVTACAMSPINWWSRSRVVLCGRLAGSLLVVHSFMIPGHSVEHTATNLQSRRTCIYAITVLD